MEEKPNIVFIIVESLGGEFAGNGNQWSGFTPFLDSIIEKSLYWKNGLSLSGRTFGIMPSLLGSLPPGRQGFMSEGPVYPDHLTLISILKDQGYHTSHFSGFDTYFDDKTMLRVAAHIRDTVSTFPQLPMISSLRRK